MTSTHQRSTQTHASGTHKHSSGHNDAGGPGESQRILLSAVMVVLFMAIVSYLVIHRISEAEERPLIELVNISADKAVYHSEEVMTLKVVVYAGRDLEDVNVSVNGIKNRLNAVRTLNISEGVSEVPFVYKLPKCNVCGGIMAGYYNITSQVSYDGMTYDNYLQVTILQ